MKGSYVRHVPWVLSEQISFNHWVHLKNRNLTRALTLLPPASEASLRNLTQERAGLKASLTSFGRYSVWKVVYIKKKTLVAAEQFVICWMGNCLFLFCLVLFLPKNKKDGIISEAASITFRHPRTTGKTVEITVVVKVQTCWLSTARKNRYVCKYMCVCLNLCVNWT